MKQRVCHISSLSICIATVVTRYEEASHEDVLTAYKIRFYPAFKLTIGLLRMLPFLRMKKNHPCL